MAGSFAARRRFGSVSHMHDVGGGSGTVREDFQTLDYDIDESTLFQQELQSKPLAYRRRLNLFRWLICMGVGVTTGLLAFLIDVAGENIFAFKFWLAGRAAGGTLSSTGSNAQAWLSGLATVAGLNMCLVASACALVLFVSPIAGGSGIPEVKAYLQGIKVPRMLRTSALVAKAVGVLGSVTGGLIVGKEGPMIHIGSVIAAGVSQGSSKTCNVRTMWLKGFRNDHDKRDFVSAGAAAGVAAAFGAPIGGTLFAMEEAATYWSQPLTWRTFFCALCSTFTLNLLMSAVKEDGHFGALSHPGLITFGAFLPSEANWDLRELPIFAGLGLLGGIFGALFVHLSKRLSTWRGARRCGDATRLAETLGVATLTTVLAFCLPLALPCAAAFDNSTATTPNGTPALTPPNPLVVAMDELLCPEGLHSGLGAMTLASHEHAIKARLRMHCPPVLTLACARISLRRGAAVHRFLNTRALLIPHLTLRLAAYLPPFSAHTL
jgi:chloride channel 7